MRELFDMPGMNINSLHRPIGERSEFQPSAWQMTCVGRILVHHTMPSHYTFDSSWEEWSRMKAGSPHPKSPVWMSHTIWHWETTKREMSIDRNMHQASWTRTGWGFVTQQWASYVHQWRTGSKWNWTWVHQLGYLSWLRIQDCSWHEWTSWSQVPYS
jgi:hypothetical protein